MGRPRRADEANGIYHALNRGNARSAIFHKEEDYEAFEQILEGGKKRCQDSFLAGERLVHSIPWAGLGELTKRTASTTH